MAFSSLALLFISLSYHSHIKLIYKMTRWKKELYFTKKMSSGKQEVGKVTQIEPRPLKSHFREWMRQPTAPYWVIEDSSAKWKYQKHQCVPIAGHCWSPWRCQQGTDNPGCAPWTVGQSRDRDFPFALQYPKPAPRDPDPQNRDP